MTTTNLDVANEIARQIGSRAFCMMGTLTKLATERGLVFNLRGSSISKIQITLTPLDTYTVEFFSGAIGRHPARLIYTAMDIYADGLNHCIEANTGLRLSL